MEGQHEGKEKIIQVEQNRLEAILHKLKTTIFEMLFMVMDAQEEDSAGQIKFEAAIDYLQMHWFVFHNKVQKLWNAKSFTNWLFKVVYFFNLTNIYFPNLSYSALVIVVHFFNFLIFLVVLDIVYVSYYLSKKKFKIYWPLDVLKSVCGLFVTVLFIPTMENLTDIVRCYQDGEGNLVLFQHPSILCFQDTHLIHALITLFFMLTFSLIGIVVALTNFDPRMTIGKLSAKQDNQGDVAFIMNKVVFQILFAVLTGQQSWVLVIALFVLSFWLWYSYNIREPFYDHEMSMFFKIVSSYFFWANFMLLVSFLLQGAGFEGGLVAYFVGMPFIGIIISTQKKSRIETLTQSQMKFSSGEDYQSHLRYVLQLIDEHKRDKNSYMLLLGYIEKHREGCTLAEECPLNRSHERRKRFHSAEQELDEMCQNLLKELDRLFRQGLKKFPQCNPLRLQYAFFLLERMKNRQKSIEQLIVLEKQDCAFDEDFLVYRFKRIITEKLDKGENAEEQDALKKIKFNSHTLQLEEIMKSSATDHKAFWEELMEDNPDLQKLNQIGEKISKSHVEARDNFRELQKLDQKMTIILKVYANYVINVLNDGELGRVHLRDMRERRALEKEHQKNLNNDLLGQPVPCCLVQLGDDERCVIAQANLLLAVTLGYQLDELHGKKLDLVMPHLVRDYHDAFVSRCVQVVDEEDIQSEYIGVPQKRFLRAKSGYLVPVHYTVYLPDEGRDQFFADFQTEVFVTKVVVYIMCNPDFIVTDITASALNFFNTDIHQIRKGATHIDEFLGAGVMESYQREHSANLTQSQSQQLSTQGTMKQKSFADMTKKKDIKHKYMGPDDKERVIVFSMQVHPVEATLDAVIDNDTQPVRQAIGFTVRLEQKERRAQRTKKQSNASQSANQKKGTYIGTPDEGSPFTRDKDHKNTITDGGAQRDGKREMSVALELVREKSGSTPGNGGNGIGSMVRANTESDGSGSGSGSGSDSDDDDDDDDEEDYYIEDDDGKNHLDYLKALRAKRETVPQEPEPSTPQPHIEFQLATNMKQNAFRTFVIGMYNQGAPNGADVSSEMDDMDDDGLDDGEGDQEDGDGAHDGAEEPLSGATPKHRQKRRKKIDWGAGIRTKRLLNNRIELIDNFYTDKPEGQDEDDEWDEENSVFNQQNDVLFDYTYSAKDELFFERDDCRALIQDALTTKHKHKKISAFKLVSFVWMVLVLGVFLYQYFLAHARVEQFKIATQVITLANRRMVLVNELIDQVLDRIALDQGMLDQWTMTTDSTHGSDALPVIDPDAHALRIQSRAESAVAEIFAITQQLSDQRFQHYVTGFNETVQMVVYSMESHSLEPQYEWELKYVTALYMIVVDALQVCSAPRNTTHYSLGDAQARAIVFNYFNRVYNATESLSHYLDRSVHDDLDNKEGSLIATLATLAVVTLIAMILFFAMISGINEQRESILFLFLDIPTEQVRMLHRNCDKFLQTAESIRELINKSENEGGAGGAGGGGGGAAGGDDDDAESGNEEDEDGDEANKRGPPGSRTARSASRKGDRTLLGNNIDPLNNSNLGGTSNNNNNTNNSGMSKEDEDDIQMSQNLKRKKIIKRYREQRFKGAQGIILQYGAIAATTLVFTVITFVSVMQQKSTLLFFWPQYFHTSFYPVRVGKLLNLEKLMLLEHDFPVFDGRATAFMEAADSIDEMLNSVGELNDFNYKLFSSGSAGRQKFAQVYQQVLYGDMCEALQNADTGQQYGNSSLSEAAQYVDLGSDSNCQSIADGNLPSGIEIANSYYFHVLKETLNAFTEQPPQYLSNLFATRDFIEADTSFYKFYVPASQYLVQYEQDMILGGLESCQTLTLIMIIMFFTFFFLFTLLFWIPYLSQLNQKINRTIEMLNILPLSIMMQSKSIKRFILSLFKQMKKNSQRKQKDDMD